jgi:hypothetical protein
MKGMLLAKKAVASTSGGKTIDELIKSGIFLCGSAATVREQIQHYQKEIGFGTFISLMQFGTLPHELVLKNTRTFAEQVIPALRHIGEPAEAATA